MAVRTPFPDVHEQYAPRGWAIIQTGTINPVATGVLCASLPSTCANTHRLSEHVTASPTAIGTVLEKHAAKIEKHAEGCAACRRSLRLAVRRSLHT